VIVAGPAEGLPPGLLEQATILDASCGHEVAVSPASMAAINNPEINTSLLCMSCAMQKQEVLSSIAERGLHSFKGGRKFLAEAIGEEAAHNLYDTLGVKEHES